MVSMKGRSPGTPPDSARLYTRFDSSSSSPISTTTPTACFPGPNFLETRTSPFWFPSWKNNENVCPAEYSKLSGSGNARLWGQGAGTDRARVQRSATGRKAQARNWRNWPSSVPKCHKPNSVAIYDKEEPRQSSVGKKTHRRSAKGCWSSVPKCRNPRSVVICSRIRVPQANVSANSGSTNLRSEIRAPACRTAGRCHPAARPSLPA